MTCRSWRTGRAGKLEAHVNLMFDLQVLAYQCDLTRVITFMLGHEHSGMTYPQIGVPDAHHPISHHQREPEKVARSPRSTRTTCRCSPGTSRSCRPRAMATARCSISCDADTVPGIAVATATRRLNIPMILAGGGAGTPEGRAAHHLKGTPLANLHLTLLDQFGVRVGKMGDSTGRVDARSSRSNLAAGISAVVLAAMLTVSAAGDSPLVSAIRNKDARAVQALLSQGANPKRPAKSTATRRSPLEPRTSTSCRLPNC